jgi:hypothetical protein
MINCCHLCIAILLALGASGCKKTPVLERAAIPTQQDGAAYFVSKLEKIVIPIIDFEDISVEEAIDFLRMRSFDLEEGPPEQRGISWIIKPSRDIDGKSASQINREGPNTIPKINYRAKDVGLLTATEEIARQAHLDVYLTNVGIVICGPGESPLPVGKMDGEEVWKTIHKEALSHARKEGEQVVPPNGP